MSVFTKARESVKAKSSAPKSKGTCWYAGNDEEAAVVAEAIHQLVEIDSQISNLNAKGTICKHQIKTFAERRWLEEFASTRMPPETPMHVQNSSGERVTYVVQNCTAKRHVSAEQVEQLVDIFGDKAESMLYQQHTFQFDPVILSKPGVLEKVEAALSEAFAGLCGGRKPLLTQEEADALLTCDATQVFRPDTVDRLAEHCGGNVVTMRNLLDVAGSAVVRYVKA